MPDRGSECSLFSFFAVSADAEENRFSNWSLPVSTVQMKFSSFRCSRERRDNCALSLSLLHYHRWKMLTVDVTMLGDIFLVKYFIRDLFGELAGYDGK